MSEDQQAGGPGPGPDAMRPLPDSARQLLHLVLSELGGNPAWQRQLGGTLQEIRDAAAGTTAPELAGPARRALHHAAAALAAGQQAPHGLHLDRRERYLLALTAEAAAPAPRRVLAHEDDWAPPQPVPEDWKVFNAPVPLEGRMTWIGKPRHGIYYAAFPDPEPWPVDWLAGRGLRDQAWPVSVISGSEIRAGVAAHAGRHGLTSPADAGVSLDGAARALGLPWPGSSDPADGIPGPPYPFDGLEVFGTWRWRPDYRYFSAAYTRMTWPPGRGIYSGHSYETYRSWCSVKPGYRHVHVNACQYPLSQSPLNRSGPAGAAGGSQGPARPSPGGGRAAGGRQRSGNGTGQRDGMRGPAR